MSAVIMFAASRFNAHTVAATDTEARNNRDTALAFMTNQFRKILADDLDEMLASTLKISSA